MEQVLSFDVTDLSTPTFLGIYESSTYNLAIKTVPGHHYLLMETNDMINPEISRLAEATGLFQDMEGGDYVIIVPEKIKNSLSRLVGYRQSQGHTVVVVSWQSIYDNFNDGIPDPMAVRSFLKWANQEWKIRPINILLVGDSSYDLKGFISKTSENWLPPVFYSSLFGGETVTDIPLTDLNGDGLPDVALGRIPFSEPDEIEGYISKLIVYENSISDRKERNIQIGIVAETESEFGDAVASFSDAMRSYESRRWNSYDKDRLRFGLIQSCHLRK